MRVFSRTLVLGGIVLVGLLALNGYGLLGMLEARRGMLHARSGATEAQTMVQRIGVLEAGPSVVAVNQIELAELARRAEAAAANVGISADAILRMAPAAPKPIANTPYLQQQTQVIIKDASLRQVLLLIHALEEEPALRASAIRLTAPRREGESGRWQTEITLSCLVYAPQSANSAQGAESTR